MPELLNNPYVAGALSGLISAAAVDYRAFQTWKSVHDAKTYAWDVAGWRWFQGAIAGLVTAAGLQLV